jgi:hypothetical protein
MAYGEKISEKLMDVFEQCMDAAKEFTQKAGEKAKDLGERGVLMLDTKQIQTKTKKLLCRLGNETFRAFAEEERDSIDREDPAIKSLVTELTGLYETLEKIEKELRGRK